MLSVCYRFTLLCFVTTLIIACKSNQNTTTSPLANCISKNLHHHTITNSREYYQMIAGIESQLFESFRISDVDKTHYYTLIELLEDPEHKELFGKILHKTSKEFHFNFDAPPFLRAFNDCPKETLIRTPNDPEGSLMSYINMVDAYMRGESINPQHLRSIIKNMTRAEFQSIEYRALFLQLYILNQIG